MDRSGLFLGVWRSWHAFAIDMVPAVVCSMIGGVLVYAAS